jgi:hypothetical protein
MSILRLMPAEDSKSKALPIVAVAVAAVMAFALFGLPSIAADVDTSATIDSTTPVSSPAGSEEQVECQRVGETLCVYLETGWKSLQAGQNFEEWSFAFEANEFGLESAGLYIYDLAPVVSTTAALQEWTNSCAGYDCAFFTAADVDSSPQTNAFADGTSIKTQFSAYYVADPAKPATILIGQFAALLPSTANGSATIVDLTFKVSTATLSAFTDAETEEFYTNINEFFWVLIQERLQVAGG